MDHFPSVGWLSFRAMPPSPPVHPRVCGERNGEGSDEPPRAGSSPRVRGTVDRDIQTGGEIRFIPACAGNGASRQGRNAGLPVHPRVCGERWSASAGATGYRGSSPRVRGTGYTTAQRPGLLRFIPACAGNGTCWTRRRTGRAVHPRVCGERDDSGDLDLSAYGSSPRVRGTADHRRDAEHRDRFIPACAGNGSCRRCCRRARTVHPRVCGERVVPPVLSTSSNGSSPRVRGTGFTGQRT